MRLGSNCIPIVMIKNEERFIEKVLRSALLLSNTVIVGDTGSTDKTLDICRSFKNVVTIQFGQRNPAQLGVVRNYLIDYAMDYDAELVMLVDGDEYYTPDQMKYLSNCNLPDGKEFGFTTLTDIEEGDPDEFWATESKFNRLAVHSVDKKYRGEYPFEIIPDWDSNPSKFHYFDIKDNEPEHGYHLHRVQRSGLDDNVYLRKQKQFQACLKDVELSKLHRITL